MYEDPRDDEAETLAATRPVEPRSPEPQGESMALFALPGEAPHEEWDSTLNEPLNPRYQRFVDEYVMDLNATKAAIRAGYAPKSADVTGSSLLGIQRIRHAVDAALERRALRLEISQDRILRELASIAYASQQTFASWGPEGVTLRSSDALLPEDAAAVSEVSESKTKEGGTIRFKLHNKTEALKLLGQHVGMFNNKNDPDASPSGERVYVIMGGQKVYF